MTTVFIWNNNQVTHHIASRFKYNPAAKSVIGHASMNIYDQFASLIDRPMESGVNNSEAHVSWWPDGGGATKQSGSSSGTASPSLLADLIWEKYAPDHVIRIEAPPNGYILRMRKEWDKILETEGRVGSYHFTKMNCSRVVSKVLRRGFNMTGPNIKYGNVKSGLWTPLMVKRLALDIKGGNGLDVPARQMTWSEFVDELVEDHVIFPQTGSLMKLIQRRASNRGSSQAEARFKFSEADSFLDRFRSSKLEKMKGSGNFPVSLLVYTEARGFRSTIEEAVTKFMEWLINEVGEPEAERLWNSGYLSSIIKMAENIPTPRPKAPPRKKKKAKMATPAGGAPPKPTRRA